MCGLYGFSGKHPVDLAKIRWLATLNQSRGNHSTGVFAFKDNKKKDTVLYKDAIEANKFILAPEAIEAMRGAVSLQGHTRQATQGEKTQANAHPFEFNLGTKVVGCHNGFVADELQKRYVKEFGLGEVFPKGEPDVDSMLIFAALSKANGDYKILPSIEGGIVSLFHLPEKYGNMLFAYKRAARDLHYGLTPEGIYISSEEEPLKLIGCNVVSDFEDDTLTILQDGQIIDVIPMEKPKIHVHLGGTRIGFAYGLSKETKELYPELDKPIVNSQLPFDMYNKGGDDYYHCSNWKKKNKIPAAVEKEIDNYEDKMIMVINDCLDEIEGLAPDNFKVLTASSSNKLDYTIDDMNDFILFIQLFADSSKKDPLPAWAIYDKETPENSTLTGVNGAGLLSYKIQDTDKERTIRLYDPVDGGSVYEYKFTPKSGRVLEVALSIPFQETDEKTKKGRKRSKDKDSSTKGEGYNTMSKLGEHCESRILSDGHGSKLLVAPSSNIPNTLSKQKDEVHRGCEGQETSGTEKQGTKGSGSSKRIEGIHGERTRTFTQRDIDLVNGLVTARALAPTLTIPEVEKIMGSFEWKKLYSVFFYYLGSYIDVKLLFEDAALLKYHEKSKYSDCKSIAYYAILLLDHKLTEVKIITGFYAHVKSLNDRKYVKLIHISKVKEVFKLISTVLNWFEKDPDAYNSISDSAEVGEEIVGKISGMDWVQD